MLRQNETSIHTAFNTHKCLSTNDIIIHQQACVKVANATFIANKQIVTRPAFYKWHQSGTIQTTYKQQ